MDVGKGRELGAEALQAIANKNAENTIAYHSLQRQRRC